MINGDSQCRPEWSSTLRRRRSWALAPGDVDSAKHERGARETLALREPGPTPLEHNQDPPCPPPRTRRQTPLDVVRSKHPEDSWRYSNQAEHEG